MTDQSERAWFAAFLQSRENFRPMRCHCLAVMHHAEGVVPIWRCPACDREVPRV